MFLLGDPSPTQESEARAAIYHFTRPDYPDVELQFIPSRKLYSIEDLTKGFESGEMFSPGARAPISFLALDQRSYKGLGSESAGTRLEDISIIFASASANMIHRHGHAAMDVLGYGYGRVRTGQLPDVIGRWLDYDDGKEHTPLDFNNCLNQKGQTGVQAQSSELRFQASDQIPAILVVSLLNMDNSQGVQERFQVFHKCSSDMT